MLLAKQVAVFPASDVATGQTIAARYSSISGRCLRKRSCRQSAVPVCAAASNQASRERPMVLTSQDNEGEDCKVFIAPDGSVQEVMCCDYGFRSGFGRLYQGGDGEIPKNFFALGADNFRKEFKQLRRSFRFNEYKEIREQNPPTNPVARVVSSANKQIVRGLATLDHKLEDIGVLPPIKQAQLPEEITDDAGNLATDCADVREKLRMLRLENEPVWERERRRAEAPDHAKAPFLVQVAYITLCWVLDFAYNKRPIQRFWFLEVVARMPYFSYISMLHLYESLGWWRAGAELRRIHFAEEWNELHHLMIMESLGGDQYWIDRFAAQHAAVFYYWVIVGFFAFSPQLAYVFSELVEGHAVDTYEEFVEENAELLKTLPPPVVALEYYKNGDLYLFDELQTTGTDPKRRPACNTLYDVFCNIAGDEREHVKTMRACRTYEIVSDIASRKLTRTEKADAVSPIPQSNGAGNGSNEIKQMDTSQLE
ncbi:probable ubiquinol oxidase 4, chloroplastic/chromoplastic at C-terminar half [Coccomyxa sp. Obi]|nr:probable ubiquinol oxidase 4, chloroplastic/chromoplastic at C-terminar half [Coccomyxa sp. Obi]